MANFREIIELAKPVLQILRTSNYIDIRFYIHKNENPFYSYNCVGLTKTRNTNSIHWKSGEQKKNGACIILLSPWLPLHCSYINYDKEWYICRYFQRYANDFKRLVAIWEICTSDLVWMTFTFCAFFPIFKPLKVQQSKFSIWCIKPSWIASDIGCEIIAIRKHQMAFTFD